MRWSWPSLPRQAPGLSKGRSVRENGQKKSDTIFKDGKELSAKYWNSKGEEVETFEE